MLYYLERHNHSERHEKHTATFTPILQLGILKITVHDCIYVYFANMLDLHVPDLLVMSLGRSNFGRVWVLWVISIFFGLNHRVLSFGNQVRRDYACDEERTEWSCNRYWPLAETKESHFE